MATRGQEADVPRVQHSGVPQAMWGGVGQGPGLLGSLREGEGLELGSPGFRPGYGGVSGGHPTNL